MKYQALQESIYKSHHEKKVIVPVEAALDGYTTNNEGVSDIRELVNNAYDALHMQQIHQIKRMIIMT